MLVREAMSAAGATVLRDGERRSIPAAEIVPGDRLAESAHAAFHKAAHYFGVEAVLVPVGPDFV